MRGLATAAGLLLLLGACAGTAPETAGPATGTGKASARRGVYKVGNPYQIGGVWYYPKEASSTRRRASPPGTGRTSTARPPPTANPTT